MSSRIGLDLHISDLKDPESYLWLKSLIWPEHQERLELFESAARCFKENPVELIEGDGITLLTDVVETLPKIQLFAFSILTLQIKYQRI